MADRRTGIDRRTFCGVAGGWTAALLAGRAARGQDRPPNVLILQPDQHRGTILGCAGDRQAVTPHLDRLASEGVRFTHAASASPVCSPFRGSFQTGLYCHRHRVVSNNIRMDPGLTTFAEVFAEAGYATGYIGKWHLDGGWPKSEGGEGLTSKPVGGIVPPERRQGWQEWRGYEKSHEFFEVWTYENGVKTRVEGHDWEPTWQTDVALEFATRHRDAGRPWLYYVAYGPPHLPTQCPQEFLDRFPPETFELPPDILANLPAERHDDLRRDMQIYYAQVAAIDHEVGRVTAGLERLGLADNTVVLYTSDHGDYLGSHAGAKRRLRGKGSAHATAFRIPLIVRWPGRIAAGKTCEALVSSVDLAPTVLGLSGLPVPDAMQGHDMSGWCLGREGHRRDIVYLGLGDNQPRPPESLQPEQRGRGKPTLLRELPAGPGIGANPTLMERSGNWDCGYDERIVVTLPPGRHTVVVEADGKGRIEVEYTVHDYVEGQPAFVIPTDRQYTFKATPSNEFAVGRDGAVSNATALRPHLYAAAPRKNPPEFGFDCATEARFEIRVTKSVGGMQNRLLVFVDPTDQPVYGGWWRAVWDGRYIYRPNPRGWLYDHRDDPHEIHNLIASDDHAAVREHLGRRLLEAAEETGDPVLRELRERMGGT